MIIRRIKKNNNNTESSNLTDVNRQHADVDNKHSVNTHGIILK